MSVNWLIICPKNSDHIMPYRLPSVIFSDRAKIFFCGLISLPQPQNNNKKNVCLYVCLSHLQSVQVLKYF